MAQSDTASVPPTLLEAAKAMSCQCTGHPSQAQWEVAVANLRAAIAREEAKQASLQDDAGRYAYWKSKATRYESERDTCCSDYQKEAARAQQAEASAAWHKAESERLSAELAKEREYKEAFRDDLNGVRAALHAAPSETATGTAMFLRQRAEKAEAECSEQLARAESGEDRNRDLSEKLIAAHGKTHAESERAKKAEAELAKVRSFLSRSQGISETLSAEDAVNAAQGIINRDTAQLARLGHLTPMNIGKVLPMVVDELLRLRGEAESAKGRMASAIAADLDTARGHLSAVVVASDVARRAMMLVSCLVWGAGDRRFDAAREGLEIAASTARRMVLDRVDPKAPAAGGLVDATPAAWFQAEIDRLRKANHALQEQNWDLRTPDFPMLAEPPMHLHYAHIPGDWSSKSDEWFTYSRLMRNGHPTKMVRVGWRHGPGVSNSALKSASPPFEGDPKASAFRSSVTGGTRACGKTTATLRLAKSLAEKGHGVVVVFPSNRAAAAHAEAAKPAVTAGPGEERRQGFDVVLFDHSWYDQAIADARADLAKEKAKFADYASKVMDQDLKAAMGWPRPFAADVLDCCAEKDRKIIGGMVAKAIEKLAARVDAKAAAKVATFNGTCSFKFAEPKDAPVEPRDPLTGWTFATYRWLLQAAFPGKEGA